MRVRSSECGVGPMQRAVQMRVHLAIKLDVSYMQRQALSDVHKCYSEKTKKDAIQNRRRGYQTFSFASAQR